MWFYIHILNFARGNRNDRQDSLISPKISLLARSNSLHGRKKFPARMRRELEL